MLADALGHVAVHAEGGGCSGGDNTTRLIGIGNTVGLGELEVGEILSRLIGSERVVIGFEVLAVRAELEGDDEGSEEVVSVLGKRSSPSCGLHHAAGGLLLGPVG